MYLMESAPGTETIINGKTYLYFGGTGYYQLHSHPEIINAGCEALKKYGLNSATTRGGYGTTKLLRDVEKNAARYFGTDDAAYIASGYLSNLAGIQALNIYKKIDAVFVDENAHYCNIDGANSILKPVYYFRHMDVSVLEGKIKKHLKPNQRPLIVTDGVFPLFGRIAPVDQYLNIAENNNGMVWVDDAHGVGVVGDSGRGTYDHYNLKSERLYFGGTLGKAFGGFGGIIPGNSDFINIVKKGNVMNGASAPPSPAAAASLKGIEILQSNEEKRKKLWANAVRFKKGLKKLGVDIEVNHVPIAAWGMESEKDMERVFNQLMKKGISIQYSNYVGSETGVLRVVLFSTHTEKQINRLLYELEKLI
ncbi:MAG: pyridoxal phosphate-dependent aminotransferase family protein [Acidobacteriota bacterium]